ncbi:MAG: sensor histidine kinase [Acidimicrobiales bacterium]
MRRRLTLVAVALVAGALLVAGAGALLVTRNAARAEATHQLVRQGEILASAASRLRNPAVLRIIGRMLRLENAEIVLVRPPGTVVTPLRSHLGGGNIRPAALVAGEMVTGWRGNLAFVAVPVPLSATVRVPHGDIAVVLLTRNVGNLGPGWLYFVFVSGITLLAAAIVAIALSRKITSPIEKASEATSRIAGGELSTRLPLSDAHIPELDLLATSINSMAASLEAGRSRERQLLLSVSHDLRTPLTSIRGYAEAINEGVTEDAKAASQVIIAESRRLERLVADLLDLAKLEARQLSLALGPVDASQVAAATIEGLRPAATANGVTLSLDQSPPAAIAWADEDRLAQVVENVVQNAIGFATSSVTVSIESFADGSVSIAVADDGPGIPRSELGRVFDRFYQVDRGAAARQRGGSGLGLSIVAELVKAMGGVVRAQSPIGSSGGTRLVVVLAPAKAP